MTREEAIIHMEIRRNQLKSSVAVKDLEEDIKAFDMAINSLKAWEKVRAEIVNLETWGFADRDTNPKPLVIRSKVLQIITKHLKGV